MLRPETTDPPTRGARGALLRYAVAVCSVEERLKLALHAGKIGVWEWDVIHNRIEWPDLVYDIHESNAALLAAPWMIFPASFIRTTVSASARRFAPLSSAPPPTTSNFA